MSQPRIESLSYEQARDELVEVVRALETGTATLEQSLSLWERGEALAAHCQAFLDGARQRLDAAAQSASAGAPASSTSSAHAAESARGVRSAAANDPEDDLEEDPDLEDED